MILGRGCGPWVQELRISEPQAPRSLPLAEAVTPTLPGNRLSLLVPHLEQVPCIMMLVLKVSPQPRPPPPQL